MDRRTLGSVRRLLLRLVVVVAAVVIALGLCELVLRLVSAGPVRVVVEGVRLSADSTLIYELAPGARILEDGASISSAGLRDREYAEQSAANTFRIGIVGDSVTYGSGVRPDQTVAKVLERFLDNPAADRPRRYEVLNFGVPGYNSTQIARRIETAVTRLKPNLVVYLYCVNDPEDPDLGYRVGEILQSLDDQQRRSLYASIRRGGSSPSDSRLYQLVTTTVDRWHRNDTDPFPGATYTDAPGYYAGIHADGPRWDRVRRDLAAMAATMRRNGVRFVGVVSLHLWDKHDDRRFRFEPPLSLVSEKVGRAFQSVGAPVLELGPIVARFSAATGGFMGVDAMHYSEAGHRLVGLAILDFLLRESLIPSGASVDLSASGLGDAELRAMQQALRGR